MTATTRPRFMQTHEAGLFNARFGNTSGYAISMTNPFAPIAYHADVIRSDDCVLITGATSGIGRETARQLGQRGCRLAITGRREDRLEEVASMARDAGADDVITLAGSVTDVEIVKRHYAMIQERWQRLDAVILNAGVGDSRSARTFSASEYRWTFDVNLFGVCNWLECVIPEMLSQRNGLIVGVSSPAAWAGFPGTGSSCASKAALSTMMESVRLDLRGTGIDVVIVCPGFVKSELTDRNDPNEMVMLLDVEDGVRRMLRGVDRRKRVVHFPFPFTHFVRHVIARLPRFIFDPLMARFARRTKKPYRDESASRSDDAPDK